MKHDPSAEPSDLVDTDVEVACHQFGKFARWDVHHDAELLTLHAEGASHREIAKAMNRSMKQVAHRIRYLGFARPMPFKVPPEPPAAFAQWYYGENAQPNRAQLNAASIWHLVDLKRAGHSPTRTELDIGHDEYTVRQVLIIGQSGSIYGSPSATCAGI